MKRQDRCEATGITTASMVMLSKNENLTTDALICDILDIMEVSLDDEERSDDEVERV